MSSTILVSRNLVLVDILVPTDDLGRALEDKKYKIEKRGTRPATKKIHKTKNERCVFRQKNFINKMIGRALQQKKGICDSRIIYTMS